MNETKMVKVGIILGIIGGAMAILESGFVLVFTSGHGGAVGLVVAILTIAGSIIVYKRSKLVGAVLSFFSTLIGQLTGGILGWVIAVFIAPPPPPWFSETFIVSSWTLFGLVGSVLILSTVWKTRDVETK